MRKFYLFKAAILVSSNRNASILASLFFWHTVSMGFLGAYIPVYCLVLLILWNDPMKLPSLPHSPLHFPTLYPSQANNTSSEQWTVTQDPPFKPLVLLSFNSIHAPNFALILGGFSYCQLNLENTKGDPSKEKKMTKATRWIWSWIDRLGAVSDLVT